jgi:Ca-activated chloride channel family protein
MVQSPVLTRIKLDFDGFDVYDVEPLSVPDVMADRPVIVFGKWRGKPQGSITLKGITGEGEYKETIQVKSIRPDKTNEALKYLWARHRIATLGDYNLLHADDKRVREVTELGLKYNLLTAYTSFIAVDSEVRNKDGKPTAVTQPLPLPEAVSDYAVGGAVAYKSALPASAPRSGDVAARQEMADYRVVTEKKPALVRGPVITVKTADASWRQIIENELQNHRGELHACNVKNVRGEIAVSIAIDAAGKVTGANVVSSKPKNKKLEQCIIDAIRKVRFSGGPAKGEIKATVRLRF